IADAPLTAQATTTSTLVGVNSPILVGHFVDQNPDGTASDFAALSKIDWGDGTPTSDVTITGDGGSAGFDVTGTHAYAHPSPAGGYPVTVTILDEGGPVFGGSSTTIHSH